MSYSFKNISISDTEKLWLQEVYKSEDFDPRIAKIKLRDKLPLNFNPKEIDQRLLIDGKKLTIIGLWYVDPKSSVLKDIETVILAIKNIIIKKPGIENITAKRIAKDTGLSELRSAIALRNLGGLGRFFSSASTPSGTEGHSQIVLSGDNDYDEYLNFVSIEDLMEKYFKSYNSKPISTVVSSIDSTPWVYNSLPEKVIYPIPENQEYRIKRNTAFILMAMDPSNPELEDISQTIKEVCKINGINAYKADEIEHQDRITDLILSEIKLCEFLIADLTYERPNVYYEIGYAHALGKRPILHRKSGTRLHFDLSVHNVPEYKNITELRNLLSKRLKAILGK